MAERECPLCGEMIVVDVNNADDFRAHLDMDELLIRE